MAPVCWLIGADCGYITQGDGEADVDRVQECFSVGDGDAGMEAAAEGEAERAGRGRLRRRHRH
jgi:hypothetical protein